MKTITCDGVDITQAVAALFDALVGSMDWGSDFLDDETVEAALVIANLVGFAEPSFGGQRTVDDATDMQPATPRWDRQTEDDRERLRAWRERAVERFKSQMRAKVAAKVAELRGDA
jgi:hypothetical protein